MLKNILFRVDSSFDIGTGHLMRDLVLASQYPNNNIIFATQELAGNINHKILENGHNLILLSSHKIDELIEVIEKNKIDLVVIDHYNIDYNFEKKLKKQTSVRILSFDDTYEKHYCDILLNHNIYANKIKYKDLVPKGCELRCGVNYTLLRDEFLNIKSNKKMTSNNRFKVFIAMGGADSKNMNISLLKELEFSDINIELVTTKANENLPQLKEYIKNFKNIHLNIDSNNIASIITDCDIAIVTPSVMVNEIVFLNIPFISIMVTDNQRYMYEFLKEFGLPCLKKEDISSLNKEIKSLYNKDIYNGYIDIISNLISQRTT